MIKNKRILVVEDEKDLVNLIRYNLKMEKLRVISAGDAETGLELARQSKPDLILLDVSLPKMTGLEFLRTIRPEIQIPIILLSARSSLKDQKFGLGLGADDYLTKPFSMDYLVNKIKRHLDVRTRRQAASSPVREKIAHETKQPKPAFKSGVKLNFKSLI